MESFSVTVKRLSRLNSSGRNDGQDDLRQRASTLESDPDNDKSLLSNINWPKVPRLVKQQKSSSVSDSESGFGTEDSCKGSVTNNVTFSDQRLSTCDQGRRTTGTDVPRCFPTSSLLYLRKSGENYSTSIGAFVLKGSQEPASEEMTLQELVSQEPASQGPASQEQAWQETVSQETSPQETSPQELVLPHQVSQKTLSLYKNAEKVPGTDQYIYPYAQVLIGTQYHERYPDLVDLFKGAVDNHKTLKYHTKDINYALRLCGKSTESAVPSIVIFCLTSISHDLHSLLHKTNIRRQYEQVRPSLRSKLTSNPDTFDLSDSTLAIIPFKLVFFPCPCSPAIRRTGLQEVHAYGSSRLTICGSQVKYKDRTATLAILLSVDSKLYGLTVDHLFKDQVVLKSNTVSNEGDVTKSDELRSLYQDDAIHDDIGYGVNASCDSLATLGSSKSDPGKDEIVVENNKWAIAGCKVEHPHKLENRQAYLDWALIDLFGGYMDRPNAFYLDNDLENPKFFRGISGAPKIDESPGVYMISAAGGTRMGVLIPGMAYIGGEPCEEPCKAWNVILSDSKGIIDGDCGSLIVNKDTLEIYGHVVASNPLGEAYVVPLQHTFEQIRTALGAKDVSLPNPGLSLANMVYYYYSTGESAYVEKLETIIASIIATDESGVYSALHLAAKHRNFNAIETILAIYAKLKGRANTRTSLFQAIIPVNTNAGLDPPNCTWKTVLLEAATSGRLETTRLVLEQIPIQDPDKNTLHRALAFAELGGHSTVMKLLHEKISSPMKMNSINPDCFDNRHDLTGQHAASYSLNRYGSEQSDLIEAYNGSENESEWSAGTLSDLMNPDVFGFRRGVTPQPAESYSIERYANDSNRSQRWFCVDTENKDVASCDTMQSQGSRESGNHALDEHGSGNSMVVGRHMKRRVAKDQAKEDQLRRKEKKRRKEGKEKKGKKEKKEKERKPAKKTENSATGAGDIVNYDDEEYMVDYEE